MDQDKLSELALKVGKNEASDEERELFFQEIVQRLQNLKREINSPDN